MRNVQWIFVHTAAHGAKGVVYDTTARQIHEWHKSRGWSGIGYQYVVRLNGTIEIGRPEERIPAQVGGWNRNAIGICFSGHGNIADLTEAQKIAGAKLIGDLMKKYNLEKKFLQKEPLTLAGHREVNDLIDKYHTNSRHKTSKSCPGNKVSMNELRDLTRRYIIGDTPIKQKPYEYNEEGAEYLYDGFVKLYNAAQLMDFDETMLAKLNELRKEPLFDEIILQYKTGTEPMTLSRVGTMVSQFEDVEFDDNDDLEADNHSDWWAQMWRTGNN